MTKKFKESYESLLKIVVDGPQTEMALKNAAANIVAIMNNDGGTQIGKAIRSIRNDIISSTQTELLLYEAAAHLIEKEIKK